MNGVKVSDVALVLGAEHFVGGLALVKRGKKNVSLFAL
jgi:hypothetical protein